ncbi:MAG: hypothetical protein IAE81_23805 [Caldilineaceae bacterium]|nr:hypothetical protein [Caldilineaceae bacterium]
MSTTRIERREVPADLIEATPHAVGMWLLASPLLGFVLWLWVDLFAHFSPLAWYWVDAAIGAALFVLAAVLPLGWLAHRLVTAAPRLFQHAGWDIQPLEPVREQEAYLVRYIYQARRRADGSWPRQWLRAAQGWVYIEIAAILIGGIAMIPLFLSAVDFGFGR